MTISKHGRQHVMAIGKHRGGHDDRLARRPFDGEAATVDARRDTLDDHPTLVMIR
jgi:hypothetical protein